MSRMRAVRYDEHGGPEVLRVAEVPRPDPGPDEVLVEVRAASVNPVDTKVRAGVQGKAPPSLPATPGTDFAGVVVAAGDRVDGLAAGDHVVGDYMDRWTPYDGTFAEFVAAPTDRVAPLPQDVTFEQAAAAAHVGTTAYGALVEYGDLRLGDTCLVHGGSGGVGHVAVQMADRAGATVVATAGTPEARDVVRDLGAAHVFDYGRDPDDLAAAVEAVGPVDVVLDHKIDRYLDLDVRVAAPGATVVSIEASGEAVRFTAPPLARQKDLCLYQIGPSRRMDRVAALSTVGSLLSRGDLRVEIARRYSLAEAAQAHRDVVGESFVGKLVVLP